MKLCIYKDFGTRGCIWCLAPNTTNTTHTILQARTGIFSTGMEMCVQLTNTAGDVVKSYTYDAFRNEMNPDPADTNVFRFLIDPFGLRPTEEEALTMCKHLYRLYHEMDDIPELADSWWMIGKPRGKGINGYGDIFRDDRWYY